MLKRIRYNRLNLCQGLVVVHDVVETKAEYAQHVNGERYKKEEEKPVVPPSNAVVYPRTMMVECLSDTNNND
jgi:hypothetical protein